LPGRELAIQAFGHARQVRAEAFHQPPRQRGGSGDADLLAEHGARGDFEAVPAAGDAQAGAFGDAAREQRFAQRGMHGAQVGIQVEHAPHLGHDGRDGAGSVVPSCRRSSGRFGIGGDPDQAGAPLATITRW
jgi:hypothetical protein